MDSEDDSGKGKWRPTSEQYDAYEKREIELAMANLKNFGEPTLHSGTTVTKARALLGDFVPLTQGALPKQNGWPGAPKSSIRR